MRRFLLLFFVICATLAAGCGSAPENVPTPVDTSTPPVPPTDEPVRHYEPAGGFSYVPPEGWEIVEPSSATAYKVARSQPGDGFAPNLTLVDEPFTGSLEEYVSLSMENLGDFFEGLQEISRDSFEKDEGSPGVRVVAEYQQSGLALHQIFYFFDTGSKKLVVTCTRLVETGEEVDALCDASVRTLRLQAE